MLWRSAKVSDRLVRSLVSQLKVTPVLARLLCRMGIDEADTARHFLQPKLRELEDPFKLCNMRPAVDRIRRAMSRNESILIIGDYDVDGVTSTTLLVHLLSCFCIVPRYVVPRRLEEGYGLSRAVIDRGLAEKKPDLVIAVDCGTNSVEEVRYLRDKGIDVVVLDHHRSTVEEELPAILVNPHVCDPEDAPWKNLCAVGLVFKVVHAIIKDLREEGDAVAEKIRLKDYLDLVAMGTIADLVPLVGENRILAHRGLRMLEQTRRRGLHALFQVSGVNPGRRIQPSDVSFRLGPRINASGRLAGAEMTVRMLLSKDVSGSLRIAQDLDAMNRERQDIERMMAQEADSQIEKQLKGMHGYVLYNDEWHPGVVGIVAGRVSRKYSKPTIVLGKEGILAKGSGRSIPGVNLVEVLGKCDELLESWGGHPMAVGVALKRENLEAFQKRFDAAVSSALDGEPFEPEVEITDYIQVDDISEALMEALDMMHPFGQGNPEPIFGLRRVKLESRPEVFGDHFRFYLRGTRSNTISGVAWKMADRLPPVAASIDLAVKLTRNEFNGRRYTQVELLDWRPSK